MADYDGSTITGTAETDNLQMPVGSLYKTVMREFYYAAVVGTWGVNTVGWTTSVPWSVYQNTTAAGDYFKYSFVGTGFVAHLLGTASGVFSVTIAIDGVLNATGVARSNVTNAGAGTYTSTSTSTGAPVRVEFTGLTLGLHTITITKSSASSYLNVAGIELITPIHYPKIQLDGIKQSTLPVGSCSVGDLRKTWLQEAQRTKVRASAIGVTASPLIAVTSYIPLVDMNLTFNSPGADFLIGYSLDVYTATASAYVFFKVYIDGVAYSQEKVFMSIANAPEIASDSFPVYLSPGAHRVELYWNTTAGTWVARGTDRNIYAIEL